MNRPHVNGYFHPAKRRWTPFSTRHPCLNLAILISTFFIRSGSVCLNRFAWFLGGISAFLTSSFLPAESVRHRPRQKFFCPTANVTSHCSLRDRTIKHNIWIRNWLASHPAHLSLQAYPKIILSIHLKHDRDNLCLTLFASPISKLVTVWQYLLVTKNNKHGKFIKK